MLGSHCANPRGKTTEPLVAQRRVRPESPLTGLQDLGTAAGHQLAGSEQSGIQRGRREETASAGRAERPRDAGPAGLLRGVQPPGP